jgi:D-alanyl-D-alanine carboxypeptidase
VSTVVALGDYGGTHKAAGKGFEAPNRAVLEDGEVVKVQGFGLADLEHSVPVTTETAFQVASLGKQFTAAAVLLLAEDGRLELDDLISRHLEGTPPSWAAITIRHLLNHTSGLPDYESLLWNASCMRRDYTERGFVDVVAAAPLLFTPGTDWAYSNSGYMVLGAMVNELVGVHWGEFLAERVFAKAGMATAQAVSESKIIPNRARAYKLADGEYANQRVTPFTFMATGDGALYLSITDLVRWDQALRKGEILSAESRELWWTPATLDDGTEVGYGLGWEVTRDAETMLVEHGGIFEGFHSYLVRYENPALTVAVLANVHLGWGRHMAYERTLAYQIAYLQRPELADSSPATPDELARPLEAYTGEFMTPDGDKVIIAAGTHALLVEGLSSETVVYAPAGPDQFVNSGPGVFFANHLRFLPNADGVTEAWLGHWAESPLLRLRRVLPGAEE